LYTKVELEHTDRDADFFEPLAAKNPVALSEKAVGRFLSHLDRLKKHFGIQQNFVVRSYNNFPKDSGLASSASSFAGLTRAFGNYLKEFGREVSDQELAQLSRQGSGSSCRSFFEPWSRWDAKEGVVSGFEIPFKKIIHVALVVSADSKEVSSSEAHKKVSESPLFAGRTDRAENRLFQLMASFQSANWESAYQTCKAEFWDMMGLFHTCTPSFSYLKPGSIEILNWVDEVWKTKGDGPIVTMDAGPNVHLLFREDQIELYKRVLVDFSKFRSITNFGVKS
jgi:diphosphomevalonate decarboxylase